MTSIAAPIWFRGTPLRAKKLFIGATHRTVSPEDTLERIRPHFRAAGLTRLADVTGLDRIGIPTAIGYRPNSPTLSSSAGKGFTLAAAMASGAMEGIEMFHAENVRLPTVRASYDDLAARGPAVARERLSLTKGSLFRASHPEFWVYGWDLPSQREIAVAYNAVSMAAHPDQRPRGWMPFSMSSNGLASGNHLLEAICAALLEAIERDALACHTVASKTARHVLMPVALETITSPMVRDLLQQFQEARVGTVLYDLRVDTDVPVYMARIYDRVDRHVGIYSGYGAHLDPAVAQIRALTEAAQSRLIYIAGSRDDYFRHDHLKHRGADSSDQVRLLEAAPGAVDASRLASEATGTFEEDIAVLCGKLSRCGLDQIVVADLTREEMGIPVVRVIVPGLEAYPHFAHFAPGRRASAFAATINRDQMERAS